MASWKQRLSLAVNNPHQPFHLLWGNTKAVVADDDTDGVAHIAQTDGNGHALGVSGQAVGDAVFHERLKHEARDGKKLDIRIDLQRVCDGVLVADGLHF